MIDDFLLWCAGSDRGILSKCSDAEKIKHVGFGTLVAIPPILAFVSMSYALSTIDAINPESKIIYIGGFIWALIIFAFDRFIVSTHRKKNSDKEELKTVSFILRLTFAFVLGVTISHPLVLLWFDGSITKVIKEELIEELHNQDSIYQIKFDNLERSLNNEKAKRDCYQKLLTAEQSGHRKVLECGFSSGLPIEDFPQSTPN